MSLITNIAAVTTDFIRHPFSETAVTHRMDTGRTVVLEKHYGAPTVTREPPVSGGYIPLGAGDELAAEVSAAPAPPEPEGPQPPKHGMPLHKMALWFFIVLSLGCLCADVALAFVTDGDYTPAQGKAVELLDWGVKTGVGAIAGVLTGKASDLPTTS